MDKNEIVTQIENDEFYKSFVGSKQKSLITQTLTITEQVKKLGEGIDIIGHELQKQIQEKHHDLLRQGNHATKLENVLNTMNSHVQNLFANAERLRNQIIGPYNALEMHTKVLARLHLASHILRQVSRIQHLSKRLSNTNDAIQKATILNELEQLAADEDLKGIDAVTSELRNIRSQQQKVVKMATGSLTQSIVNENIAQTTTALQIFINLGTINATLDQFLESALAECREGLKAVFETSGVSSTTSRSKGLGKVNLTSSQGFRNRVWVELERVFTEDFYQQCKQIRFLQEAVTNLNSDGVQVEIAAQFWSKLGDIIRSEIKNASPAIQQTLEEDYPKLLKCYYEIYEKLKCKKFVFNRQVLETSENSYLSSSLTKLLDPVQQMFASEVDVPSHDQIDSLIRIITSELSVSLIEASLSEKVCRNVSKCLKMFAVKAEQQVETGPEAVQVIGGSANSGQQKNVQLVNTLYYLQVQIKRMLSNMKESLSEAGIALINEGLQALSTLVGALIQPLIVSINSAIESIIITIHLESDWGKLQVLANRAVPCSPYMKELTQFINRVYHTYLENFEDKEVLFSKCSDVALRCIDLLVRHSSLLRPLSQGGRQRLQSDYQQLENSLKLICPQLTDLGRPYRLLKSMASLVAQSPEQIVASQAQESSVPHSTVLLLLFSFAGSELASPHQNTGWSLPKLSIWLDEHPLESDRLDLIAGALQKYETLVRQKNSANWDPVYPVMSQFLENAVKSLQNNNK